MKAGGEAVNVPGLMVRPAMQSIVRRRAVKPGAPHHGGCDFTAQ
ncbi:hypothetical protein ABIB73_003122 [Bradyrhizobium sp. F1.4.3]